MRKLVLGFSLSALPAVLALGIASPVSAQPYDQGPGYERANRIDEIEVIGRRPTHQRSAIGAPIENLSLTREVRYDDLDLRTHWGAHELRERIVYAANEACRALDRRYPEMNYPKTEDSPPCVRTAIDRAMDQADAAISDARRYASRE